MQTHHTSVSSTAYHCMDRYIATDGANGVRWLETCLSNTRARLLQKLGITSGKLRGLGLYLHVAPTPCCSPPGTSTIASIIRVLHVDETLRLAEALYEVDGGWRPLWQGITVVSTYSNSGPAPLPPPMVSRARSWIPLIRDEIPEPARRRAATDPDQPVADAIKPCTLWPE